MAYFYVECRYLDRDGDERYTSRMGPGTTLEAFLEDLRKEVEKDGNTIILLREKPKNGGKPFAVDILIDAIVAKNPSLNAEELRKDDWMILNTDRNDTREGSRVVPLSEAKAIIDGDDYQDFVYIRSLGLVVFDVGAQTSHQMFCGQWAAIEKSILTPGQEDEWDVMESKYMEGVGQDVFLDENYGIFMSRAYNMRTAWRGKDWKLQGAERAVFGLLDFRVND